MKLECTVKGEPVGKGRPRFSRGRKPYTPEKTATYEDLIRQEFFRKFGRTWAESGVPVTLDIVAEFGIPKRTSRVARAKMLAWEIRPTKRRDKYRCVRCQRYSRRTPATTVHHHRTDLCLTVLSDEGQRPSEPSKPAERKLNHIKNALKTLVNALRECIEIKIRSFWVFIAFRRSVLHSFQ